MVKMHLKRLAAPRSWPIARKNNMFIIRPYPGGHGFAHGFALRTLLVEILGLASSASDLQKILAHKQVLVDGVPRTHPRHFVGLFDVIELPQLKQAFRLVLSAKGALIALPVAGDEAKLKVCKIVGKTSQKGGAVQLNLHDGTNVVLKSADHKVGESLVLRLPGHVPEAHLKLEKDAVVYLAGGAHQGNVGTVQTVEGNQITLKVGGHPTRTLREFAFIIGKGKPLITVN